ncbi:MAG: bifunctional glycosyltransferase family 2/GtrA family protein [Candidatus Gastranaerophilales bacterium]|nr:bifunctional glycosyltransferase family 2/GtrA family protein [Candidatus Gastranaerophilales bacterium]
MKTLSLIIPIFNEEKTLESIVQKTLEIEKDERAIKNNISLELVLVDDCSSDNSLEIAQNLAKNNNKIKVFSHSKNQGKGAALKTGFKGATGDFIGIQDADNEYNPFDYLKLIEPLLNDKADVVYGSRYLKQDTRRILYFWHTFMNKGLTLLTNMYTNLDITDMETCYKLFKKDVIKSIVPYLKENRFGFEPEVTIYVAKGKYRVYECAISYNPRTYEEGKKIGAKDGLRALYCILHYGGQYAPLPMQILLYLFIGGLSAIVNIGAFLILTKIFECLLLNIAIAFIISALTNYLLCISLLFKHKARWSSFGEIVTYIITLLIMGAFDYYSTYWFLLIGMNNFWAKSLSSLIGVIGNFALRKYFVFQEKKN